MFYIKYKTLQVLSVKAVDLIGFAQSCLSE